LANTIEANFLGSAIFIIFTNGNALRIDAAFVIVAISAGIARFVSLTSNGAFTGAGEKQQAEK